MARNPRYVRVYSQEGSMSGSVSMDKGHEAGNILGFSTKLEGLHLAETAL